MASKKNILMTVGVTGLLLAALFVLFPSSASAAQITGITPGGVTDAGTTGTADAADYFFVTANVLIPQGDHIPLDFAKVTIYQPGATATNGILSGTAVCETGVSTGALATVVSVTGNTATSASYSGQGYTYTGTDNGYGYQYGYGWTGSPGGANFAGYSGGTGYGYGYAGGDVTVTVKIKVEGCYEELTSDMTGITHKQYRLEVKVGGNAAVSIVSLPATATFVNLFQAGTTQAVADTTGFTIAGGAMAAGQVIDVAIPGTGPLKNIKITVPTGGWPVGTKVVFNQQVSTGGVGAAFGVSGLGTQFPGKAIQFQLELQVPGQAATTNLGAAVTLRLDVDSSYLNSLPASSFRVWAYDGSGSAKGSGLHPGVTHISSGSTHAFDVAISHYSSYAAGGTNSVAPSGGGGGGGAAGVTTTTTQTAFPVTETTTTVTSTTVVDGENTGTSSTQGNGTPGLTVGLLAIALAGAAIVVRRRV